MYQLLDMNENESMLILAENAGKGRTEMSHNIFFPKCMYSKPMLQDMTSRIYLLSSVSIVLNYIHFRLIIANHFI